MKVLINGWTKIPHSYSIVNVFQIVSIVRNYPDVELFLREDEYFRQEWKNKTSTILYPKEYYDVLNSIQLWNNQDVDLIYSVVYPYDINVWAINGKIVPKCIFYTSEFSKLSIEYFKLESNNRIIDDESIKNHLKVHEEILYFTSPSTWSSKGLNDYNIPEYRNRIITHGVDTDIFKPCSERTIKKIKKHYNIQDSDIVLGNIGAMTSNKGIILILQLLHYMTCVKKDMRYKLFLKGTEDLYTSRAFLEGYLKLGIFKNDELVLMESRIIFIDKTCSFEHLNIIYNMFDLYISPYLAEGFNLVPLEVLATGTHVLLPSTGSTVDYTTILTGIGCETLHLVKSVVNMTGNIQNEILLADLIKTVESATITHYKKNPSVHEIIKEKFSWNNVAGLLYNYWNYIIKGKRVVE